MVKVKHKDTRTTPVNESDVQMVSPADPLQPSSSTNNKNLEQEKGKQDHDTKEPISSSKLRSTPAQDQHNMETDQMTKTTEAHKAGLDSDIVENRKETIKIIKSLSSEKKKRLRKKLVLQKEADRKKMFRANRKRKVEELMEKRPELANYSSCLATSQKKRKP